MICPGFFAHHGRWKGISMTTLLQKAKVKDGATLLTFSGPEGKYEKTERFYLKDALSNKVFLAYESLRLVIIQSAEEPGLFDWECIG